MNKIILKYDLYTDDMTKLVLPSGAKPLYVNQQNDNIKLWVEVDEKPAAEEGIIARSFYVVPTGASFKLSGVHRYLGTVLCLEGALVWHVYEVTND